MGFIGYLVKLIHIPINNIVRCFIFLRAHTNTCARCTHSQLVYVSNPQCINPTAAVRKHSYLSLSLARSEFYACHGVTALCEAYSTASLNNGFARARISCSWLFFSLLARRNSIEIGTHRRLYLITRTALYVVAYEQTDMPTTSRCLHVDAAHRQSARMHCTFRRRKFLLGVARLQMPRRHRQNTNYIAACTTDTKTVPGM